MGKIADLINRMIDTASKSMVIYSPRFSDYRVAEILNTEDPDIEKEIEQIIREQARKETRSINETQGIDPKTKEKIDETASKLKLFEKGNVGDIQKLSSEQFSNVRSLASDPFSFISHTILRKIRSGAGILFIITIATEVIKFLIEELFKPGRPFDIRFREEIGKQTIQFLERREQQELRSAYKSVITTTIGGLRGESLRGQIGGNFYTPDRIPPRFIDQSRISKPKLYTQDNRKKSFQDVGVGLSHSHK